MNTFTNKYINSFKDLSKSNIGIEVEFYSNYKYVKTLELLNLHFNKAQSGVEVWGINQYHSNFEVTDKIFKIEPDFSGGSEMVEFITGPMKWVNSKLIIIQILDFIKKYGYTDDHCSIHINISFDDLDVVNMDTVKMILNFDENYIYERFPQRRDNIYAKSIKKIVPYENWKNPETALNQLVQSMQLPDDTKYYGINFQKKYMNFLEFRYIGGDNFHLQIDDILELVDYFILQTRNAIENPLNEEDKIKLLSYLEENINWYKQYKSYDDFLANIDGIVITVDKIEQYKNISMHWSKFKDKLYELIKNTNTIKDAHVNYNTMTNRLEIINATIVNITNVHSIDFIDCIINNAILFKCDMIDCTVKSAHLYDCNVYESNVEESKIMGGLYTKYTELLNCLFDGGKLDCIMKDGVFRSGQILTNAEIQNTTKMANKDTFWKIEPTNKKIAGLKK
jgi:hypothetical protein